MNILLVEDEPKVAEFIKKGLKEQHFNVDLAYDGVYGEKLGLENEYDLIILDVVLPGINGLELCARIRKYRSDLPILMLTALGTTKDKVLGFESGADDYLVKPFHFEELMARIKSAWKEAQTDISGNHLPDSRPWKVDTYKRLRKEQAKKYY